jgi:serine/threonine-protein kinase
MEPRALSDRNLIFGILALQMDFIDQSALVAAMNAWVLTKTRTLGSILVERGLLSAEENALLERLLEKHLERHGDDVHQSLESVRLAAPTVSALARVADADLQASVRCLPQETSTDYERTVDYQREGDSSRYQILRRHARGGLGEVFVALDGELHREVALKEIRAEYAGDAHSRARFVVEAEITGGLEHPGTVPVYGLGRYADGRPYYAMRFIQGETLKEAIQRFHQAENPGRDTGERTLAFRQLLGRFVAVCNTVAYAHSRGVLHRDIKPSNVLLGRFGEALVVDWGLAKVIGRPDPADGDETLRPTSSPEMATAAGAVVGTPVFLSPEQADGKQASLGPASDVYSLGATLYVLLTGEAPISGKDRDEILEHVRQGRWQSPRSIKPSVPLALDAVCRKAMALKPSDRYDSALSLAADLEHWLADEPVSAFPEPRSARVRRWGRNHRPLLVGAAAAAAVALVSLAVSTGLLAAANRQIQEQTENAKHQAFEASLQRRAAVERLSWAKEAVDTLQTEVGLSPELRANQLHGLRTKLLESATKFYERFADVRADDREVQYECGRTYLRLADLYREIGRPKDSENAFRKSLAVYEKVLESYPTDWIAHCNQAYNIQGMGHLDWDAKRLVQAEQSMRVALSIYRRLMETSPSFIKHTGNVVACLEHLALILQQSGQTSEARKTFVEGLSIIDKFIKAFPDNRDTGKFDRAFFLVHLGTLDQGNAKPAEAEKELQEALRGLAEVEKETGNEDQWLEVKARACSHLSELYRDGNRLSEATAIEEQAVAALGRLAGKYPTNAGRQAQWKRGQQQLRELQSSKRQ